MKYFHLLAAALLLTFSLSAQLPAEVLGTRPNDNIVVGAERLNSYLPQLQNRKVAIVANPTSVVGETHLVDTLLALHVNVVKVFAPEHGFRGDAEAGAHIKSGIDEKTGLPIVSLYGSNKKPTAPQLADVDIIIFDIQDVGARFYTYISTLHYVMEAAAENNKKVIVLDRPNPNGFYVDGPVLQPKYKSFVGMHPIPIVHGMTIGELARMINGEGWLEGGRTCDLSVVACVNYAHLDLYTLPIAPSPNLPNMTAIYLYPSLCLFEGTSVSVGRGTELPFQVIGHPGHKAKYAFIPQSIAGVSENPKHQGETCYGHDLTEFGNFYFTGKGQLYLEWLIGMNEELGSEALFSRPEFFDKLAGTDRLRKAIIAGKSAEEIRLEWKDDVEKFKKLRRKYLLYSDFE
ncbi:MAG: DUF1343 domain-containing protein [Flavobacteriales bacterium]|nr:DUF1343 domain-containing protein [Flavobacteriales bacterium]